MRIAKKRVGLGDMSFCVGIDRNIAADVFEKYPDALLKQSEAPEKKKEILGDKEEYSVYELAKEGKLSKIVKIEDEIDDFARLCVCFALPMMLEKAGENAVTSENVIQFVEDNEMDEFYSAMWEFIVMGFTGKGGAKQEKPKFSMT